MFLSNLSIKRPVFATVLMLALVTLGLFSYRRLSIDMMPDVEIPILSIITVFPGASPETVEREVTKRIEEAVNPIPGRQARRLDLARGALERGRRVQPRGQDQRGVRRRPRQDQRHPQRAARRHPGAGHPEARLRRHADRLAGGALGHPVAPRPDHPGGPQGQAAPGEHPRRRQGQAGRRLDPRGRRRARPGQAGVARHGRRRGGLRAADRERQHAAGPAQRGAAPRCRCGSPASPRTSTSTPGW